MVMPLFVNGTFTFKIEYNFWKTKCLSFQRATPKTSQESGNTAFNYMMS